MFKIAENDTSGGIGEAFETVFVKADDSMPVIDPVPFPIPLLQRGPGMTDAEYDSLYETSSISVNLDGLKVKWCVSRPENPLEDGAEAIDIAYRFATMSTKCDTFQPQDTKVDHC